MTKISLKNSCHFFNRNGLLAAPLFPQDWLVSDSCEPEVDVSTEVTSDEPMAIDRGSGGRKDAPDAEITDDSKVLLRVERSGKDAGRAHVITALQGHL